MQPGTAEIHGSARADGLDRMGSSADAVGGFDDEDGEIAPRHQPAGRRDAGRPGPDDGDVDPILHAILPDGPHVSTIVAQGPDAFWTAGSATARVA